METDLHRSRIQYEERMSYGEIINSAQEAAEFFETPKAKRDLYSAEKLAAYSGADANDKKTVLHEISFRLTRDPLSIPSFIISLYPINTQGRHHISVPEQSSEIIHEIAPDAADLEEERKPTVLEKVAKKEGKKILQNSQTMDLLIRLIAEPEVVLKEEVEANIQIPERFKEITDKISDCATIILKGIVQSITTEEEVVQFMEHFTRNALQKRNQVYDQIFFSIYSGIFPVLRPEDLASALLTNVMHSESDNLLARQMALHECAMHLSSLYTPQTDLVQQGIRGTIAMFQSELDATHFRRLAKDYERTESLDVFYRTQDKNVADVISADTLTKQLVFPESAFYQPNETWRYYHDLLHRVPVGHYQTRTIMLVSPKDNMIRLLNLPHEDTYDIEAARALKQVYSSVKAEISDPLTIENALQTFTPDKAERAIYLRQEYTDILNSEQVAYGFSIGGDIVVLDTKKHRAAQATEILFTWGDNATINLTLTIGGCRMNLSLNPQYELTHRDGSELLIHPHAKIFWETLVASQLVKLFSKSSNDRGLHGSTGAGEEIKTRRPPKAHRVILPPGHSPTIKQSVATAKSPHIRVRIITPDGVDVGATHPENLLNEYNRLCPRDDGRLYTFALPQSDSPVEYRSVRHHYRDSLDELESVLAD